MIKKLFLIPLFFAGLLCAGQAQEILKWDSADSSGISIKNSQTSHTDWESFPIYNDGVAALSISLSIDFPSSNFGQGSSFGVFFEDENGEVYAGKNIWTEVKNLGVEAFTINATDWGAAKRFGIFIILNAGSMGKDFVDGVFVEFTEDPNGGYNLIFQGKEKNANIQFIGVDVNGVMVNENIPGAEWTYSDGEEGDVLGLESNAPPSEATSLDVLDGNGTLCWRAHGPHSLVGFARSNFHVPPGQLKKDKEVGAGIVMGEDGKAYVVEHGKVKKKIPLHANAGGHGFCIRRENGRIIYSYEGVDVFTSYWIIKEGVPLMVNVIVTEEGSYVEEVSGAGFVDRKTDFDMDGLPNEWEEANGLNPKDKTDALEDPDGDGVLNWMEYQDGQDPTVAQYAPVPQNYLWWLRGQDFTEGEQWGDLSQREHDSVTDTWGVELIEENGKKYARFDLGDEMRFGEGTEPWLKNNAEDLADFTLMVICRPLWNGTGYQNLIDLSATDSTNGFRIGIQDGFWLLESAGEEGAFLENFDHPITVGKDIVLVVNYEGETGLAEIWLNGIRQTWAANALIKNITGEGYIHKLSTGTLTENEEKIKTSLGEKMMAALSDLLFPSAYAQEEQTFNPYILMREVALWGRTLTYTEIESLNAAVLEISEETLYLTSVDYCGNDYTGSPNDDADNDGLSHYEETIYGTDPNDKTSNLDLGIIRLVDGRVELNWWGAYGRIYKLEGSTDLNEWLEELNTIGQEAYITIEATTTNINFWRYRLDGAVDSDGDEVPDWLEECIGSDPNEPDTDGDGISDGAEIKFGTAPNRCEKLDTDGDGIDDWYEASYTFLSAFDPADAQLDEDGDEINNLDEYLRKTDPENSLSLISSVYADSAMPDNSLSGYSKLFRGCDGPKKDIMEAFNAATEGDTVYIMPGNYTLPLFADFSGKSVHIVFIGNSTISVATQP